MHFDSKLADVGTTIFTVMSRRALEENALNIGQGFPDYPVDPRLSQALIDVIAEGSRAEQGLLAVFPIFQIAALRRRQTAFVHEVSRA